MKRCIPLLILITITVFGVLAPACTGAQPKGPGVTVKSDGKNLVLIPDDPGKVFVVFAFPNDAKSEEGAKVVQLPYQTGQQELPTADYSRFLVLEVTPALQVSVQRGAERAGQRPGSGLLWTSNPCKPSTCIVPVPPWPPGGLAIREPLSPIQRPPVNPQ